MCVCRCVVHNVRFHSACVKRGFPMKMVGGVSMMLYRQDMHTVLYHKTESGINVVAFIQEVFRVPVISIDAHTVAWHYLSHKTKSVDQINATMKASCLLLSSVSALLVASAHGGAVSLTLDNFDSELGGKNGIVKFFAPWCGHCKYWPWMAKGSRQI